MLLARWAWLQIGGQNSLNCYIYFMFMQAVLFKRMLLSGDAGYGMYSNTLTTVVTPLTLRAISTAASASFCVT